MIYEYTVTTGVSEECIMKIRILSSKIVYIFNVRTCFIFPCLP